MRYQTMYRLLVVTVFLLLMAVGIYLGTNYIQSNETKKSEEVSNTDNKKVNVYNENKATDDEEKEEELEDVSVNYVDIYSECKHSTTRMEKIPNSNKENVIKDIENSNNGYSLIGENDNILVFEKKHTGKCHEHYKVILEDDEIKIYKIGDSGNYEFYQSSGIISETIREDLITALTDGIEANGLEELYIIMEDIES